MKKCLFTAVFLMATSSVFASRSVVDFNDFADENNGGCQEYGMYIRCTGQMESDIVCWGEGTGTPTYQDARNCMIKNSQLLTEFICGRGFGTGPTDPSIDYN